ncbi:MAG: TonB family protein [Cyclobacteriaceae bacterium]|nr:TonB family protein [Cyclobacteriaceae bacterium HetDA_MAG_MS6]
MSNSRDKKDFLKYLSGGKKGREAQDFEKSILNSTFETEAMEGLEPLTSDQVQLDLEELKKRVDKRTFSRKVYYLRIAATIALLITFGISVWVLNRPLDQSSIALQNETEMQGPKLIEKKIAPPSLPQPREVPQVKPTEMITPAPLAKVPERVAKTENDHATRGASATSDIDLAFEQEKDMDQEQADVEQVLVDVIESQEPELGLAKTIGKSDGPAKKTVVTGSNTRSKARSKTALRTITGTIITEDGDPAIGVTVLLKGSSIGAISDLEGKYQLQIPEILDPVLVFNFIGFEGQEVDVSDRSEVDVEMNYDVQTLSEVVVVGYGEQREVSYLGYESPEPVGGMRAFKEFIEDEKIIPQAARDANVSGKVILRVSLDATGKVEQVEVRKGLGFGCDEEAIRLVQAWNRGWEGARKEGDPVSSTLRIKIKFP